MIAGKRRQVKSCRECTCTHNRDQTHGSKLGISVLLTVTSIMIKLETSLLVTVTALDGEWGVVSAVLKSHKNEFWQLSFAFREYLHPQKLSAI